jgi:hypothetical protein
LRMKADIFGFTHTTYKKIRDDFFPDMEVNSVNKLFESVRKQNCIQYPDHRGSPRPFKIINYEFKLPDGTVRHLPPLPDEAPTRTGYKGETQTQSELVQSNNPIYQNSQMGESSINTRTSSGSNNPSARSPYKDNDKRNDTNEYLSKDKYPPEGGNEQIIKAIASEMGENNVNTFISLGKQYGLVLMKEALKKTRRRIKRAKKIGDPVKNPAAYFTSVLKDLYEKSRREFPFSSPSSDIAIENL